jgi:hypothetical protein
MTNLKSIGSIWAILAERFGADTRDIQVFNRRLESNGASFLFGDLPQLGRSFDRTLITGEPLSYSARFARCSAETRYPLFLNGLFKKVLEKDGHLKVDPEPIHIKQLRQLLLLCYKTEVPYNEIVNDQAIADFTARDSSLTDKELPVKTEEFKAAKRLMARILGVLDPRDIRPRHGPGATSCGTDNWSKYHSFRYFPKLDRVYPYAEHFFFNASHLCDELQKLYDSVVVEKPHAKLVLVPKDQRGPRLICAEPREHQFIQQGLMRLLYKHIESHPLTKGFVNFTDQTINGRLAEEGSIWKHNATLDLKDASDRVRSDLVRELVPPLWWECLDACRTAYVELPNGQVYGPMAKFAPMGSAVCFPIEALVFWVLLRSSLNVDVYVYGDDIVVPIDCAERACHILESYDLKVNVDKSCYKTPFRESCGYDFFNGSDVSYVKLRQVPKVDDLQSEVSLVEFANLISESYGESLGTSVQHYVDHLYGPHFVHPEGGSLCYKGSPRASNDVFFRRRWNRDYQVVEYLIPSVYVRSWVPRGNPKYHWCELLRKELTSSGEHYKLGQYAEPNSTLKYGWKSL